MSLVRLQDTISVYKKINWILYTSGEKVQTEIKKRIAFTITLKKQKYLEVNLIKDVENIHWKLQNTADRN